MKNDIYRQGKNIVFGPNSDPVVYVFCYALLPLLCMFLFSSFFFLFFSGEEEFVLWNSSLSKMKLYSYNPRQRSLLTRLVISILLLGHVFDKVQRHDAQSTTNTSLNVASHTLYCHQITMSCYIGRHQT